MLSPDYYESCADDILKLYEQLENDVISDIIRRMMKTGTVTESAKHQAEVLQEAGLLYDDILMIIARNTDAAQNQVKALFEDAGVEAVNFDNEIYRENGLTPVDIRQSPAMRQTLEAGYRKTLGNMKNLTLTTAVTSQTNFINACNQAFMQVTSGAFSYQEAIKQAIKKTAENGAMVLYPSGHQERIDVAIRRAVLTGVGQTCKKIGEMNAEESGCDLMEITAHSGARPDHAKWQGQLVSLSGRNAGRVIEGKKVLSLRQIGYGKGDGFGGWGCRHDWFPFFEGYSKPVYSDGDLKRLDEINIEYNDRKYSQYEISQIQRRYEREIRAAKREQTAFKTAVQEADNPELKQVMQDSLNYANDVVKRKQAKMRDFINQTGQKRNYFREQNYGNFQSSIDYMSRFTPKYSDQKKITTGTINMHVKKVSNSRFDMFTDIDVDRKNKAVRLTEKNLLAIQDKLPKGFEMPTVAVVDFNKHHINPYAIGGYDKYTRIMYFNSQYDTREKVLDFVNKSKGHFANTTEYAPFLHELGHKYYEDSIKRLAISKNMSYNNIKKEIDRKIYDYIESKGGNFFAEENLSGYANIGYNKNEYTEIIAECFSVRNDNLIAKEILSLLEDII